MDTLSPDCIAVHCLPCSEPKRRGGGAGPAPTDISPEAILQLGLAFWGSKTLLSAVELGVFTELGRGPLAAGALIERLELHRRGARDFLDALVALGMLKRESDVYANTPAAGLFLDRTKNHSRIWCSSADCGNRSRARRHYRRTTGTTRDEAAT